MFAKITRSSSLEDSSRQLFKFDMTVSSVNCDEQGPSPGPREHLQPSCRNFLTLADIWVSFSECSKPFSSSPSIVLRDITCNKCEKAVVNKCLLLWRIAHIVLGTRLTHWPSRHVECFWWDISQLFLGVVLWNHLKTVWITNILTREKRRVCLEMFLILSIEPVPDQKDFSNKV